MSANPAESVGFLLLIAALVSMLARRLRLPYTVGLTLAGLLTAQLTHLPSIPLTGELIFGIFLPPLIFEASLQMEWKRFKADLPVTCSLATLGVILSSGIVAAGAHYLLGWGWVPSLTTAVLISATDPVAVISTFKDLRVGGRVQMLVESESLLNDGTAAVLFGIVLAASAGGPTTVWSGIAQFVVTVGGGILCGAVVGGIALLLAGRASDHLVELTFTTIAAYGSFLLAERFHLSGVLATMTAGILLGNIGSLGAISDEGREAVESFWEYIGFVANSLVFLLIGISLALQKFGPILGVCAAFIAFVTIGRAAAVYVSCALLGKSRFRVSPAHQHVLFWGGLRGALGLALALGLPDDFEGRSLIQSVTFAVVAFSVVVQGLTMTPLLTRLGVCAPRTKGDPSAS